MYVFIYSPLVAQLVESASNAGDPGSVPGLGRSPGEGATERLHFLSFFLSFFTICQVHMLSTLLVLA